MTRKFVPVGTSILIALSLILAACSAVQTPTAAPTLDANLVYTQAAQTVQAGINATASARPPATSTTEPSATAEPTATQAAPAGQEQATATLEVTPTLGQLPADSTAPTNTPAAAGVPPAQPSGDKCDWVDQSPKDGSLVKKSASWDMTIVVKNSGTTTWDKQYALKFWGGDRLGSPADFYVVNEVKPGDMYRFVFTMKAPADTGKKKANWVIQNGSGGNFCPLFLEVEIVE